MIPVTAKPVTQKMQENNASNMSVNASNKTVNASNMTVNASDTSDNATGTVFINAKLSQCHLCDSPVTPRYRNAVILITLTTSFALVGK